MSNQDSSTGCVIVFLVLGLLFLCCGIPIVGMNTDITYSEGFRDGQLQKVSETGIIWKTHEGYLILPGFSMHDGTMTPNTFEFSVTDPAIIAQLEELQPQAVIRVHYRKVLVRNPKKGETSYYVTKVEAK